MRDDHYQRYKEQEEQYYNQEDLLSFSRSPWARITIFIHFFVKILRVIPIRMRRIIAQSTQDGCEIKPVEVDLDLPDRS